MRVMLVLVVGATVAGMSACSECAGTPACTSEPIATGTGSFITHKTGAAVAGVALQFVRRSGIPLDFDTIRAVSGDDGFFTLRMSTAYTGYAEGDLTVTPPAPY